MLYLGIDHHKSQLAVNLRSEDGSVILNRRPIGDIDRLKRPDSLADYFGLTPGCRNSGEATQRLGSTTKQGSKIVRYWLGQAVVKVLRFDGVMRAWFK
jgi:transposase